MLSRSRLNLFLACGREKAAIVKSVLLDPIAEPPLPAWFAWHHEGRSLFVLDKQAAAGLPNF